MPHYVMTSYAYDVFFLAEGVDHHLLDVVDHRPTLHRLAHAGFVSLNILCHEILSVQYLIAAPPYEFVFRLHGGYQGAVVQEGMLSCTCPDEILCYE